MLKVLQRPGTPLHTNASENDLRSFVTKRKISGGTMSRDGRVARDTMLGLMKTCRKLGLSFWRYLGDRLQLDGPPIPPLATLAQQRLEHGFPLCKQPWQEELPWFSGDDTDMCARRRKTAPISMIQYRRAATTQPVCARLQT